MILNRRGKIVVRVRGAIVLLVVWIAAFFIPSGVYEFDESGSPIPGSYQ